MEAVVAPRHQPSWIQPLKILLKQSGQMPISNQ